MKWVFILLLACVGCVPTSGEICQKTYVAAHAETNLVNNWDYDGNLTVSMQTVKVPDRWYITIRKIDETNKQREVAISVTKEQYDHLQLGEYFSK